MLEYYEYGEMFFNTITSVGSFLLDNRISLSDLFGLNPFVYVPLKLFNISLPSYSVPVAYFLLGSGLIMLLVFKLIKFILDIVL